MKTDTQPTAFPAAIYARLDDPDGFCRVRSSELELPPEIEREREYLAVGWWGSSPIRPGSWNVVGHFRSRADPSRVHVMEVVETAGGHQPSRLAATVPLAEYRHLGSNPYAARHAGLFDFAAEYRAAPKPGRCRAASWDLARGDYHPGKPSAEALGDLKGVLAAALQRRNLIWDGPRRSPERDRWLELFLWAVPEELRAQYTFMSYCFARSRDLEHYSPVIAVRHDPQAGPFRIEARELADVPATVTGKVEERLAYLLDDKRPTPAMAAEASQNIKTETVGGGAPIEQVNPGVETLLREALEQTERSVVEQGSQQESRLRELIQTLAQGHGELREEFAHLRAGLGEARPQRRRATLWLIPMLTVILVATGFLAGVTATQWMRSGSVFLAPWQAEGPAMERSPDPHPEALRPPRLEEALRTEDRVEVPLEDIRKLRQQIATLEKDLKRIQRDLEVWRASVAVAPASGEDHPPETDRVAGEPAEEPAETQPEDEPEVAAETQPQDEPEAAQGEGAEPQEEGGGGVSSRR